MSESIYAGLTSQTIDVFIQDTSSTIGAGLTGLTFNTAGFKDGVYYRKGATGTATKITLATQTVGGAWASGGFVEIDATNMPGMYRFDLPNAMVDTTGFVTLIFRAGTNVCPTPLRIDCRALPTDAKAINGVSTSNVTTVSACIGTTSSFSGTSLSGSVGSVTGSVGSVTGSVGSISGITFPTNFNSWSLDSSGRVLLQPSQPSVVIPTVTTVTNQLSAAQVATGVWQDATAGDFTVVGSIGKSLFTSGNAPGAASGLAIVGSNMGTVASVTGSVGSVTGSVGSVTGAVGSVTAIVTANATQFAGTSTTGILTSAGVFSTAALANSPGGGTIQNNITITAAQAQAALTASTIGVTRGDQLTVNITGMGNISTRTKLWFTAKRSSQTQTTTNTDSAAVIQITEAGGLVVFNGSSSVTASHGSLTVTNATTGAATVVLNGTETAQIPLEDFVWDVQYLDSGSPAQPHTIGLGSMIIAADVTQATS